MPEPLTLNKFVQKHFIETAVEQELREYILHLNESQKQSVLQLLKIFLNGETQASVRISLEQYNKDLDEAEAAFERGEYITHEEMLKQMKKW